MTGHRRSEAPTSGSIATVNGDGGTEVELRWPQREGAVAYRVIGRDMEHDRLAVDSGSLAEARYLLSDEVVAGGRTLRLRIDVQYEDGEWTAYGPAFQVPSVGPADDLCWLRWSDDGAGLYRVLVSDYARRHTLVDEIVLGTTYPLRRSVLPPGGDIRWRARPWGGEEWQDAPPRALPAELLISEPPATVVKPEEPRMLLLFTIDTEGGLHQMRDPDPARTIDQLVFGDFGGGESLGVGLQMDLLDRFGFRGVFFVDVLLEYTFGREALERTIEAIAQRGHEIELHLHDEHFARSEDPAERELAGALRLNVSADHIRRALDRSVCLFAERVGRPPRAFRSGAYHVSDELLALLPEFGILFDTSLNRFRHAKVSDWMMTRTQPFRVGELLELPVSWQLRPDRSGRLSTRLYAPNRTPGDAITAAPAPAEDDPLAAVYVSHSFSMMRKTPATTGEIRRWRDSTANLDRQFAERLAKMPDERLVFYEAIPDDEMLAHARLALERIAARDDAWCVTFEDLATTAKQYWRTRSRPVDPVFILHESGAGARVAGSRIYSRGLLERLSVDRRVAVQSPAAPIEELLSTIPMTWDGRIVLAAGDRRAEVIAWLETHLAVAVDGGDVPGAGDDEYDAIVWLGGLERLDAHDQAGALGHCFARVAPDGLNVLGAQTLGIGDGDGGLPFAVEMLFPSMILEQQSAWRGDSGPPWDGATYASLIREAGFDVLDIRRQPRPAEDVELLARHEDKIRWLDPQELSSAAVLIVAQRPLAPGVRSLRTDHPQWTTVPERWLPLLEGRRVVEPEVADATLLKGLRAADPGHLDVLVLAAGLARCPATAVEDLFQAVYRALAPGGDLLMLLDNMPVSTTSALACAMRAGLEVIEAFGTGALEARLVRPFEPADLDALQ